MATREQQHPFYKPLWRRIVIVAVIVVWAGLEFYMGERGLWLWAAIGALVYAVYIFFLSWPKDDPPPQGNPPA
jgi:hypothetical protein